MYNNKYHLDGLSLNLTLASVNLAFDLALALALALDLALDLAFAFDISVAFALASLGIYSNCTPPPLTTLYSIYICESAMLRLKKVQQKGNYERRRERFDGLSSY